MTCVEGKFPVNPGDELCPTAGHQQFVEEREPCNLHVCPVDCKWYPWGRWAACSQTCRTGQKMGTKIRTRKVKVQAKGTGAKCGSNSEESVPCGKFPECPVDAVSVFLARCVHVRASRHPPESLILESIFEEFI